MTFFFTRIFPIVVFAYVVFHFLSQEQPMVIDWVFLIVAVFWIGSVLKDWVKEQKNRER